MTTTIAMMPVQPDPELSPERLDGCEDSGGRYEVVPSVVCSMCCLFGIIYCFFGESRFYGRAVPSWSRDPVDLRFLLWVQATAASKR